MAISEALDTALNGVIPDSTGAAELIEMLNTIDVGTAVFIAGGTSGTVAATKWSTVEQLTDAVNFVSVQAATSNYFRLPAAARGLGRCVVNIGASTAALIGASSGVLLRGTNGVTTHMIALGENGAAANAVDLVCDGTNWHRKAI